MEQMPTLTLGNTTYEVVDSAARAEIQRMKGSGEEIEANISAEVAAQLADKAQLKPETDESVEQLEASGDTSKIYLLPDGYLYMYINGAWTPVDRFVSSGLEDKVDKVIEACCDVETYTADNYNLLKVSECTLMHRLQDESVEMVASNTANFVTGVIPVTKGKYYTISCEIDGNRVTTPAEGNTMVARINVHKKDGMVLAGQKTALQAGTFSQSSFYINADDIAGVQIQVHGEGIDVSTAEKIKAYKIMITSANSLEASLEKALTFDYMDGDAEGKTEETYSLKPDATKANKADLSLAEDTVEGLQKNQFKYSENFVNNERFIKAVANLRDESTAKEFQITIHNNSGKVIKNAGIAVGLHNEVGVIPENNNLPFQVYDEIFSAPIGFKFFDAENKELPYYIESESNCNYISDKNIKTDQKTMAVFSDGKIAVYNKALGRMQLSANDGATWVNICENITSIPYRILSPDSQDNLFVASNDGYRLYKYTSADGYMTGAQVIDMETDGTQIGSILAEDSDGNLYLGTYQTEWHCVVRKSTDYGNTWSVVFDTTECQHVHNIFVNKKVTPNEIFIALDASSPLQKTYVSTNAGESWELVDVPYGNRDYAFRYAGENFYIGCGERNVLGGATLYKTTDYKDTKAYYTLFDNAQGVRDIINVVENSDDVLIAGGCVGGAVMTEQLFLSEDRGETWQTVLMRPYHQMINLAGQGLRTFSRKGEQIISEMSSGYAMRFAYGNGAKTILTVVSVGDIPVTGKTITLKTGYVASVEQMGEVLTAHENIDGKVADIRIRNGYVVDAVSNKRVLTDSTEWCNHNIKLGQTSAQKILNNYAYRLNGAVNLGKLSRLSFTKGFTLSLLFKREDGKSLQDYLSDDTYHVIFSTGDTRLVLWRRSLMLFSGSTNIFSNKLYLNDAYLLSVNEDYVRVTMYVTADELPIARSYTENIWTVNDVTCAEYPITQTFSENDFFVGNSLGADFADMPNIARIEIYNKVLSHGEIMSLTNGCNLVTDGSEFN